MDSVYKVFEFLNIVACGLFNLKNFARFYQYDRNYNLKYIMYIFTLLHTKELVLASK